MEYGEGDDLDSFMFNDDDSHDSDHSHSRSRRSKDGANKSSTRGGHHEVSTGKRSDHNAQAGSGKNGRTSEKGTERGQARRERRPLDKELAAALASSDEESDITPNSDAFRNKRRSRLKPKTSAVLSAVDPIAQRNASSSALASTTHSKHQHMGHFERGDHVEARFGGKSKWYPGEIQETRESPAGFMYNILYDDGDNEAEVIAGRVRRPGQAPPGLEAGRAVEVKLARKGKGYHPGVIGRINDDGTLYVKLDDGDTEWSIPAKHAILSYAYTPPTAPPAGDAIDLSSNGQVEMSNDGLRTDSGAGGAVGASDRSQENTPHVQKQGSPCSAYGSAGGSQAGSSEENGATDQRAPVTEKSRGNDTSVASRAAASVSSVSNNIDRILQAAEAVVAETAATPALSQPHPAVTTTTPAASFPADAPASGLDWIVEVAKSVPPIGSPIPSMATGMGAMQGDTGFQDRNISTLADSAFVPVSGNALPETMARGIGSTGGPAGTGGEQTRASAPTHLDWKPLKDGSVNRRWGAPPPDPTENPNAREGIDSNHIPNHSPGEVGPRNSAPTAVRETSTDNAACYAKGEPSSSVESASVGVDSVPGASVASLPHRETDDSSGLKEKKREIGQSRVESVGEDCKGRREPSKKSDEPKSTEVRHRGGEADPGKSIDSNLAIGEGRTIGGASKSSLLPALLGDGRAVAVNPETRGSTFMGNKGKNVNDTRWDTLRSSVQRRYAAEAMHLSEEVRLLKAKLNAADDKTRAKLKQQERALGKKFSEELESEREKLGRLMASERAAGARKVRALRNELEVIKRRVEEEKTRNSKETAKSHGRKSDRQSDGGHSRIRQSQRSRSPTRTARRLVSATSDACLHAQNTQKEAVPSCHRVTPCTVSFTAGNHLFAPPPPPPLPSPEHTEISNSNAPASIAKIPGDLVANARARSGYCTGTTTVVDGGSTLENVLGLLVASLTSRDDPIQGLTSRLHGLESTGSRDTHRCSSNGFLVAESRDTSDPGGTDRRQTHNKDDDHRELRGASGRGEEVPSCAKGCRQEGDGTPSTERRQKTPATSETLCLTVVDEDEAGGQQSERSRGNRGLAGPKLSTTVGGYTDGFEGARIGASGGDVSTSLENTDSRDNIQWRLETERRDMRRRLEMMKGEVARVVGQFRERAERAEARAASADERARVNALRHLQDMKGRASTRFSWSVPTHER